DQAHFVTAEYGCTKILHDRLVPIGLIDIENFRHNLARALAGSQFQLDLPLALAPFRPRLPQGFKAAYPTLVARSPCLHAFSYPVLPLRQPRVDRGILTLLTSKLVG